MVNIKSVFDLNKNWIKISSNEIKKFKIHQKCPVCGSGQKFQTAIELGNNKNIIEVKVCSKCKSIFYKNYPDEEFLDNYYQTIWNKFEKNQVNNKTKKSFNNRMSELMKDLSIDNKKINILDVGCGKGGNLNSLNKNGFNNIWGIEYSINRFEISNKFQPGKITNCDYSNYKPKQKFDIIYSNHVIEHTQSPNDLMEWKLQNSKDNALIIISAPDSRYEPVTNQLLFLPHLHSISIDALKIWEKKFNLKLILWQRVRHAEFCAIFIKNNPNFLKKIKSSNFLEPKIFASLNLNDTINRLQYPFRKKGKKILGYGPNHNAKNESQFNNGYIFLNKFYGSLFKILCYFYKILFKYISKQLSKYMFFFLKRLFPRKYEVLAFRYLQYEVYEIKKIPQIKKDNSLQLLIK